MKSEERRVNNYLFFTLRFSLFCMNILILANKFNTYSTRQLRETFESRGHSVRLLSPFNTTLLVGGQWSAVGGQRSAVGGRRSAVIFSEGKPLPLPDVALLRVTAHTAFGLRLGRAAEYHLAAQLQLQGVYCVNKPEAKRRAADKFLSLQILSQAGLPVPSTALTWDAENIEDLAHDFLGEPLVLKANDRTWGQGVTLADDAETAAKELERARKAHSVTLAQRCIAEAAGQDIRVFVVGEKVAGAMRRRARPGEFRANAHLGGSAEGISNLPAAYADLALTAAKTLHLDIAGVDLLESAAGPLILEVNSSPGLKMIESATGKDIAGQVVEEIQRMKAEG